MLKESKIIISVDGPDENVLKMKPPMCLTMDNAEDVVKALTKILERAHKNPLLIK